MPLHFHTGSRTSSFLICLQWMVHGNRLKLGIFMVGMSLDKGNPGLSER
ncbi:hypothetical protein AERO8C_50435 [Aeromonas veronii]|uniref:Uncharacterized protein n=1 Tax=Aeromonas veronii TaxID=654 RepID=A0A653LA70_AERVE|nr:hypothetical protein AERO8C_50435 [Aeromonas veronii]